MNDELKIIADTLKSFYQPNNTCDEANTAVAKKIIQNLFVNDYRIVKQGVNFIRFDLINKIKKAAKEKNMLNAVDDYLCEWRTEKELETFFECLMDL